MIDFYHQLYNFSQHLYIHTYPHIFFVISPRFICLYIFILFVYLHTLRKNLVDGTNFASPNHNNARVVTCNFPSNKKENKKDHHFSFKIMDSARQTIDFFSVYFQVHSIVDNLVHSLWSQNYYCFYKSLFDSSHSPGNTFDFHTHVFTFICVFICTRRELTLDLQSLFSDPLPTHSRFCTVPLKPLERWQRIKTEKLSLQKRNENFHDRE